MTSTGERDLVNAWRVLQLGGGSQEFALATIQLGLDAGYGQVRLARNNSSQAILLVPIESGRRPQQFNSGRCLKIESVQYAIAESVTHFIQVNCLDGRFVDVFISFSADVVRRLREGNAPNKAVDDSLTEFRELFQRSRALSLEELVGAFGELTVLQRIVGLRKAAVRSWTGPLPERHDFSARTICAEVKTTLRSSNLLIYVNGLGQLDPPDDGRPLYLIRIVLSNSGGAGLTTIELLDDCISKSGAAAEINELMENLFYEGYREDQQLREHRFIVNNIDVYHVDVGFPRLSSNAFLPGQPISGVREISYALDLGYARQFLLPDVEAAAFWSALAEAA